MKIKHALAALSFAAVVTLAGCSDTGDSEGPADPGAEPGASDQGADPGQEQMPEADLSDVPEVVAEVNGDEISKEEFTSLYEPQFQQQAMMAQQGGQEMDEDELKTQVADQLVDNRLLIQAAEEAGVEATDEDVDAILEEVAQQNGLGSADEVIAALEEQGQSEEQIREDAATQHKLDTYIGQEADIAEPSEEELRQQYDEIVEQQSQAASDGGGEGADQQAEVPPFEEVRDQLAEEATAEQENAAATEIVTELRESADITVNL